MRYLMEMKKNGVKKKVEINRVGERRRACTAGKAESGWKVRERENDRE